jgi:hypothetical protein
MKLLRPILTGVGVAFGMLGCAILLRCLFLVLWLGGWEYADFTHFDSLGKNAETGQVEFTEYHTGEGPWYAYFPAWGWGLACFGVSGVCFAANRFGNKLQRLRPILKKLAIGFAVLIAVLVLFILEENIRGRIALHSYLRELRAHGEKLTLADFDLPKPATENNGAPALLALTNQFESLRQSCPFEPGIAPMKLKFVMPGRALVRCEQPDLGINLRRRDKEEPSGSHPAETGMVIGRGGRTNTFVFYTADWTDLQQQILRASNTLTQIRTALAQPALSASIDYSQGMDARLPHVNTVRAAAIWLAWAALNDLHQHNLPAATEDIATLVSFTRFQKDEKHLISQIVRQAIAEAGWTMTWEALQTNGWSDAQLNTLQQKWQSFSVIQELVPTAEMNRIFFRQLFRQQHHFPTWNEIRPGAYDWRELFDSIPESIRAVFWRLAWLEQDELHYLRRSQLMLDHARAAVSQGAWTGFALSDKDFPYATSFYDRWRYVFSNIYQPPWETAVRKMFQFETQREMTITVIAIKRYQLRTGQLPADLTTLVPEYLPQLPHDWMDGQSLRYHPNPDGTFTLYSVGVDGHDDGGDPVPIGGRKAVSIWDGRDAVWPMPASAEEVASMRPSR